MAVAAQDALPGDGAYLIKRVIEGAQSTLTVDQVTKGETLLANASGRLAEVLPQGRHTPEGIGAAGYPRRSSPPRRTTPPTSCWTSTPRPATATR